MFVCVRVIARVCAAAFEGSHGEFQKDLGYERLYFLVLVHNEAQSRELAGA